MVKLATAAGQAADSENEDMLAGEPVGMPEDWEDHISHWRSHSAAIQSRVFKEEAPPEVKQQFKIHLHVTEQLMLEKAKTNPLFQAKLAELQNFPIFFHGDMDAPSSAQHQEAMVQGQSNRGDVVTGQIPGQSVEDKERESNS
jgi:hypothetical protein